MEVSKLQKRKQTAEEQNNKTLLAEICNKLGNQFVSQLKYSDALNEFRQESNIYQALDKKIDYGRANRMIGEVFLMQERYQDALKYEEIYLKVVKQEKDMVEMQRAYATIGRCFLLLAEDKSVNGSKDSTDDFKAAEKAFLKGLIMCKDLTKLVSKWELADMQARLHLNLGVTKEQLNETDDAISYYETAIKICKSNDLFELHHKCLMALGFLYSSKKDDYSSALNFFNLALEVAKRIQDKNEKKCETLLAKSGILIKNGDFQSSKQVLKKAYKLQTPNAGDKDMIQSRLKIVLTLCRCEDDLVTTNSYDYAKRKKLFEKLGDGSCKLKNFGKAIEFYLKALEASQLNGESEHQLIPIYVSLYQTYIDNKEYNEALEFMKKEYELIKTEPKEAALTLMGLGNLLDLAGKDFWESEAMFRKALEESRKVDDQSHNLEKDVMRKFMKLCRKRFMSSVAEMLEQEAMGKGFDLNAGSNEDTDYSEDILELSNDFDLELQLSSDPESSDNEPNLLPKATTTTRKRQPAIAVKKNAKGETKLHEACINGNYQLAKMLIDQGHGINVRDNAGWLPLHEASIHGFRDVVELLLDSGAHSSINDKGGTSCDGITPLYDAASNGNLSVVQLLLDRGAKSTVKTDFNETPLDALLRWYGDYGQKLSSVEKSFYEEIKQRLVEECEKVGIDTSSKKSNTAASSGYSSAKSRNSQSSQLKQNLRFNSNLSEESESEENLPVVDEINVKKNARLEYKNVMSRLKNPNKEHRFGEDSIESKRRSAHLTVKDVDHDEWLEDDLGPSRKKQKFYNEEPPNEKSPTKPQTPVKSFTRKSSSVLFNTDSEASDSGETVLDAFDVVMNAGDRSQSKPKRRSSTKSQSKPPSQSSLLDSGFSRFLEAEDTLSTSPLKDPSNNSSFNDSFVRQTQIEKQLIIKVQVGEEKIIVPVNKDASNELKISWLTEEAARRYYCIKGIRPDLQLKTADGATLLQTDPVALILSLTEENFILSEILDWNLPSLSKRYIEACSELKCSTDRELNELLEVNRSAVHLDLSNQNLDSPTIRPILRALQHQNSLLQVDLSNNFIGDEGLKFLGQMLVTLNELELLNISGNIVTESGLENLSSTLVKSQMLREIRQLKIGFNPIRSSSLKFVSALCQSKNIISLSMTSCDLTETNNLDQLTSVKNLDVSYNHLTAEGFKGLLKKFNSAIVETINFERCSSENDIGNSLVQFISSGCYACLKEINLAGLDFNENEILDILRSIEKCEQLKTLDLSYQKQLTFLSLKYILVSLDSPCLKQVKLIGCKNLQNSGDLFNLQSIDGHRQNLLQNIEMSLPKATSDLTARKKFIERMKELWDSVSRCQGKVEHDNNILRLTQGENDDKENPFHL